MIICETQFTHSPPDPKNPRYALHEVDFYANIPSPGPVNNHRLSLRYDRELERFEVYAFYYLPREREEIITHSKDFADIIAMANDIVKRNWNGSMGKDEVCQHEYPVKAHGCKWGIVPETAPGPDIIYRGVRDPDTLRAGKLDVYRCGEGKLKALDPRPSQKLFNHSPDGFQWGYGGSGPAQLALAILLDATGDPELSVRWHQTFKRQFVAGWGAQWEITRTAVREWVNKQNATIETGA